MTYDFAADMAALAAETPLENARIGKCQTEKRPAKVTGKAGKLAATKEIFSANNPGLIEFLRANTWSDFFSDLLAGFEKYGSLTPNQIAAVTRSRAKMAERAAAKTVAVDLSPIKAMFDAAASSGLKRTKYRAEGVQLTRAPDNGRNAGAIYVTSDAGEYLGKVMNGAFSPMREATDAHKAALLTIAANPREAAVRWGQKTGRCSCCGRDLTAESSIAMGIGPICAEKWGL